MLRRIHFDAELDMKLPVPRKVKGIVGIAYLGQNKYEIKAMDMKTKEMVFKETIEFPMLKGNGRKSYAKLRDMALNIIESKPLGYARKDN